MTDQPSPQLDKRISHDEVIAQLESGMTIGIGGWGSRRKPMSLVRAIARSELTDLTVVSYGGPDIGILAKLGKIRKAICGFVSLDSIPLEPHFRVARQAGSFVMSEIDEGAFYLGLLAASHRVPFYPTRAGIGSDMLKNNPDLKTIRSPYTGGPYDDVDLVAIPAMRLDASFIHMNRGDQAGNGQYLGPDPYFDDLFAMAADKTFMSVERVVATPELLAGGAVETIKIPRLFVHGVVEAPMGAHFTECPPDYPRDEAFQKSYAATAKDEDAWAAFKARWIDVDHDTYVAQLNAEGADA